MRFLRYADILIVVLAKGIVVGQEQDLSYLYDFDKLHKQQKEIKKIFFYRICGTGMGAAAILLKQAGYIVEGADYNFGPPMGDYLKSTGIPCIDLNEMDLDYCKDFDLIIVGNIVAGKSIEARAIEQLQVPFSSFPTALGALILENIEHVVGIAGTHGKTTTTYLAMQIFELLGDEPGYFIGGVVEGREAARPGKGKYFFIEADEYETCYFQKNSKFQHYRLTDMILTSLEFDHAEFFQDIHAIEQEFNNVIPSISGHFIVDKDYAAIQNLNLPVERTFFYGKLDGRPEIHSMNERGTEFTLEYQNTILHFSTNLIGQHNIENLSAVLLFALQQGFSYDQLFKVVGNLKLVRRRQEVRGKYKGAIVIDDFAHHPRAVDVTLNALKIAYPKKKMVVVFGASSATARSNLFQNEFVTALQAAEQVILLKPLHTTSVKTAGDLDVEWMAQELEKKKILSSVAVTLRDTLDQIDAVANENTLLVILSNSNCNGLWESDFVQQII